MVLYPLTSNQQIRSHIACYLSISSKYPMKGGSGFSCFPMFPQDVLKLWHIKFSPKAGSSTFASKSTMASLKVLIFSDSGGTWLEGNPCHAALKSSAPNKPLKDILSSRHSSSWYILIHCFGTVVGLGAPQEWKCSQFPQFLWAEKMVFVSPAGEGCCWSLKAPMHHHWSLKAPNAQKAGWKFEVYLLHLITPKQQSTTITLWHLKSLVQLANLWFFYRAKKEALKKNHSAQPPTIFQRSVENPWLNSIFYHPRHYTLLPQR